MGGALPSPFDVSASLQATASADGVVRIYEAMDVMNLSGWNLMVKLAAPWGTCTVAARAVRAS